MVEVFIVVGLAEVMLGLGKLVIGLAKKDQICKEKTILIMVSTHLFILENL